MFFWGIVVINKECFNFFLEGFKDYFVFLFLLFEVEKILLFDFG